jgi:hypothetical protein
MNDRKMSGIKSNISSEMAERLSKGHSLSTEVRMKRGLSKEKVKVKLEKISKGKIAAVYVQSIIILVMLLMCLYMNLKISYIDRYGSRKS